MWGRGRVKFTKKKKERGQVKNKSNHTPLMCERASPDYLVSKDYNDAMTVITASDGKASRKKVRTKFADACDKQQWLYRRLYRLSGTEMWKFATQTQHAL